MAIPKTNNKEPQCGLQSFFSQEDSLVLRVRAREQRLSSAQLLAIARVARLSGCGAADITARGNLLLRGIRAKNREDVATALEAAGLRLGGLCSTGGVAITVAPTSGIDTTELCDVRHLAEALYDHLENQALLEVRGKLNLAFDNGGGMSVVVASNDVTVVPVARGSGGDSAVHFRRRTSSRCLLQLWKLAVRQVGRIPFVVG
jgi:precorrin-3B synthase